jgi:hypothetical protein
VLPRDHGATRILAAVASAQANDRTGRKSSSVGLWVWIAFGLFELLAVLSNGAHLWLAARAAVGLAWVVLASWWLARRVQEQVRVGQRVRTAVASTLIRGRARPLLMAIIFIIASIQTITAST